MNVYLNIFCAHFALNVNFKNNLNTLFDDTTQGNLPRSMYPNFLRYKFVKMEVTLFHIFKMFLSIM